MSAPVPTACLDSSAPHPAPCAEEYLGLCSALEQLESRSGGAPLVCVTRARLSMEHESPLDEWEPDELTSEEECSEVVQPGADGEVAGGEATVSYVPAAIAGSDAGAEPLEESRAASASRMSQDGEGPPVSSLGEASSPLAGQGSRQLSSARSGWEML